MHSIPIQFHKEFKLENGTRQNKALFGYLDMILTGANADEIHKEPTMINDDDCMLIKR